MMLEGRLLELFFFLLSCLEDACKVCNQACDSLGQGTAWLRC